MPLTTHMEEAKADKEEEHDEPKLAGASQSVKDKSPDTQRNTQIILLFPEEKLGKRGNNSQVLETRLQVIEKTNLPRTPLGKFLWERQKVVFHHFMMYHFYMILKALDKKIDFLVEQKLNELLGDPDSFLSPNKRFLKRLKIRISRTPKLITHSRIEKKYGLS